MKDNDGVSVMTVDKKDFSMIAGDGDAVPMTTGNVHDITVITMIFLFFCVPL